jgi:two-component system phosphate regulon sensor histidine kinase PhoR
VKATDQIRNGNYEFLVPQTDNDEIGHLAEMIHAMAARVKSDIDQLKVLQDIRKDFVANASHELRTPVSSIRGYMETLLDGAMHDEQVSRKFLERALSNVIRLETIVNDMLDLSRLESCDRGLSLRYFEVAMIIRNILAEFEDAANRKGVELIYESPLPADFKIMADPYQFDKALINLLENAIKYTEAGYVKVNASAVAQFFVLTIEDSGSGIRAEDIPRIFERFYRADRGRSRQLGGSGLGLSIVRHIMEIHRGTVTVESELGKGTIFTMRFPQDAELSIPK